MLESKVGLVFQEKRESPDFLDFLAHQEWLWTELEDHLVSKEGGFIAQRLELKAKQKRFNQTVDNFSPLAIEDIIKVLHRS